MFEYCFEIFLNFFFFFFFEVLEFEFRASRLLGRCFIT
jgi:hypothetical protein